jgi:hypothetical protein
MEENTPKTTISDRLSTGAAKGVVMGAAMGGTFGVANAVNKLFNKSSKFAFSPIQWKITGAAAAIGAAYGIITANKAKELKSEAYLEKAIEQANDPSKNYSQKEREQLVSNAVENVIDDKVPKNPESTKYRDIVTASRAASSRGLGV